MPFDFRHFADVPPIRRNTWIVLSESVVSFCQQADQPDGAVRHAGRTVLGRSLSPRPAGRIPCGSLRSRTSEFGSRKLEGIFRLVRNMSAATSVTSTRNNIPRVKCRFTQRFDGIGTLDDIIRPSCALGNLLPTRGLTFGTFGVANPCVFGKPLVHHVTERTIRPAEEDRRRAKRCGRDVFSGGDWPPRIRATDHKHPHMAKSYKGEVLLRLLAHVTRRCEESIKDL